MVVVRVVGSSVTMFPANSVRFKIKIICANLLHFHLLFLQDRDIGVKQMRVFSKLDVEFQS